MNYDSEEKSDTSIQYVLLNCYIFGTFQKDVKREREKINLYSNKLKKKMWVGVWNGYHVYLQDLHKILFNW